MVKDEPTMFCSHCGNQVHFKVLEEKDKLLSSDDCYENYEHTKLLRCLICKEYTIKVIDDAYRDAIEDEDIHLDIDDWFQVYPSIHLVDTNVPDEIRDLLMDSRLKMQRSPELFFISSRKILEKILNLHGYKEGVLKEKINKAAKEMDWPFKIKDMAHYIRKTGNTEAHEFKKYGKKELDNLLGLTNYCIDQLVDYLYISKARIEEIKKSL
jgi:hypothetical protein